MSTSDPYAAPKSVVADSVDDAAAGEYVAGGQQLPSGAGVDWFRDGWRIFMRQPGMWIGLILVFMILFIVLGVLPFVGGVATMLLTPVFTAGMMLGCRDLENGGELRLDHLFAGFRDKAGALITIGAIYLGGWILIFVAVFVIAGASVGVMFFAGGVDKAALGAGAIAGIALAVLIAMALSIPVVMASWFAAPLVIFHDVEPLEAMKSSIRGCLKNWLAFLVYGLVGLLLMIPATLALMLGWLVLGPVIAGSIYAGYRSIFLKAA